MMEVKHSPATQQMEFRSKRNGRSDNVEEDIKALFEDGDSKVLTQKAEKCDAKVPILNGISKHAEEPSPVKVDDIDLELEKESKSNDKSAAAKDDDAELYDLDLEPECTENTQNGGVTDASQVRDTGDDLDTLLSKINDLVEDCMDEPKESAQKAKAKAEAEAKSKADAEAEAKSKVEDIVDIADDDLDDEINDPGEKSPGEGKDKQVEDGDAAESTEKEDRVIDSEKAASDKMDSDDVVLCLDSPLNENISERGETADAEDALDAVEEDVKALLGEESSDSRPSEKEPAVTKPPEEDDDDVLLIEDDEDEEPTAVRKPAENGEAPTTETEQAASESGKETAENDSGEKESDSVKDQERDEATVNGESSQANAEEDEIVCLDDSFEEVEDKKDEQSETAIAIAGTEEVSEDSKQEAEQDAEASKVTSEETTMEDAEKESVPEASAAMEVDLEETASTESASEARDNSTSTPPSTELPKEEENKVPESEKPPTVPEDDDVVILDDDDDQSQPVTTEKTTDQTSPSESCGTTDEGKTPKESKAPGEEEPTSDAASAIESSAIMPDNSDNARDGVEEKEDSDETKEASEPASVSTESNSCSDSLLKESKKSSRPEIEEAIEQPPTKKLRLSQDESNSRLSIISQEETKSNTQDNENDELTDETKPLKRVHSTDSLSADFKKPKTEAEVDSKADINDSIDLLPKVESKHLPLYPPPKLDPPTIDLSLDFLKRFKKTIHKMTKADLEELVLQKIVEAIVHKSEFSEMRELIEKQDKIIAGHRTKITELNKQFRDLEMVHNRVLKDLETKNAQFVMPVKITRAVGLQVFFPAKKYDPTLAPLPPQTAAAATTPLAHNPRNASDRTSHSSPVPSASHTPKSSTTTSTQATPNSNISLASQQTPTQRRGCVQKLTPLRPDTPRNSPLNRSIGVAASATPPPPAASKDQSQKFVNRPDGQKARVSATSSPVNAAMKAPATAAQNDAMPPDSQEKHRQMNTSPYAAANSVSAYRGVPGVGGGLLLKRCPKYGKSDPMSVAQPLPPAATVIQPSIPLAAPAAFPASSKTAQKSVIDLTDEDDVIPPPPASNVQKTPLPTTVPAAGTPPQPQAPSGGRSYKVSVVPQHQLQQPKPNIPKQVTQRQIAPKPNGAVIRPLSAAPSRYRHPAPLPNQPPHTSNPGWKLPPARPTIRISNLESGIVISWTIEDTARDKYAESTTYQIYAYQETSGPPLVESWRHVGDVKAMLLPMAVTLTQFQEGQRYYFAVRAVDAHNRCGPFSFAKTWS